MKQTRRNFTKSIGVLCAGLPFLGSSAFSRSKSKDSLLQTDLIEKCREYAKDVNNFLTYSSPLRKVFMTDEFPENIIAHYKTIKGSDTYIARQNENIYIVKRGTISISVTSFDMFYNFDNLENDINSFLNQENSLLKQESNILAGLLNKAVRQEYIHMGRKTNIHNMFDQAFKKHGKQEKNLQVANVIVHPKTLKLLKGLDFFDDVSDFSNVCNLYGHIWMADVILCNKIKSNEIYLTSSPDFLGAIPIEKKVSCSPYIDGGYLIWERIGAVLLNDGCVSKIVLQ